MDESQNKEETKKQSFSVSYNLRHLVDLEVAESSNSVSANFNIKTHDGIKTFGFTFNGLTTDALLKIIKESEFLVVMSDEQKNFESLRFV